MSKQHRAKNTALPKPNQEDIAAIEESMHGAEIETQAVRDQIYTMDRDNLITIGLFMCAKLDEYKQEMKWTKELLTMESVDPTDKIILIAIHQMATIDSTTGHYGEFPHDPATLAERTGLDLETVTDALDRLQHSGLLLVPSE